MNRNRMHPVLAALAIVALLVVPAAATQAGSINPPPIPITGPRLNPPIPLPIYDLLVNAPLTINALEANAFDGGQNQQAPGRGIKQTLTGLGAGLTLYDTPHVCNNFNPDIGWAAFDGNPDIWTDWYSGWGPFALDDGEYKADVVAFTRERVVGPGNRFNDDLSKDGREENSIKIASFQPYAAGFGSPIIPVPSGYETGTVQVTVSYLIWDHDQGGDFKGKDGNDYDWASLGVKPGAAGDVALYENGYVRGEWAQMVKTIELGGAKDIMVLLQAQSPTFVNSNIYFDDVKIAFQQGGAVKYLKDCTAAEAIQ